MIKNLTNRSIGPCYIKDIASFNPENIGKEYQFTIINYLSTSDVIEGRLINMQQFEYKNSPSRAKRLVQNNDILISTVRPNLKHYYFVKNAQKNLVASTGFVVIRSTKVNPLYLYYFLIRPIFTKYLTNIAESHTSAYPTFPKEIIENTQINLPSINEQEKIGKILSDLDSKIELNQKMNDILEQIAQTIFKSWFVDYEFPDEDGRPYRSSGGEMVWNEELGKEIPKKFKSGKYLILAEIKTGKSLRKEELVEKGKFPVIGANGEIGRTNKFLFDENLIVTGRVGTLGKTRIVKNKTWISDNVLISKIKNKEYFYYSYYIQKNFELESLNRGSTQPLITQTDLKNQICIIPNQKILFLFDSIISSIFDKNFANISQNNNISQIRDALLPKLISGKIRVPIVKNEKGDF